MAKISLICEQCGGHILLDDSSEVGTCESCFSQFIIKPDQTVQKITQHITKYVYGYQGKDVEELLADAYKLLNLGDNRKANAKFKRAIDIEPDCWGAWLGYASTGGSRDAYLSMVPAYISAYNAAVNAEQEMETYVDMTRYLPDRYLREAFVRAFNLATRKHRHRIFERVAGVIGCDESEIALLAIDLCPEDWRAWFAMAKFRQVRARWATLEGGFFRKKRLPAAAAEVLQIFLQAYWLAKNENDKGKAKTVILSYIEAMGRDNSYAAFANEVAIQFRNEG